MLRTFLAPVPRGMPAGITLGSTLAAFGLTTLLGLQARPFLIPMVAVMISAIYGGLWAGVASGALTVVLVDFAVVGPVGTVGVPSMTDLWQFATFGTVAFAISFLTNRRGLAEGRLREQAHVLEAMVAERDELLRREQSARADAEQASRVKDEFLATLSHELRTPLNAVLGWSQILTEREIDVAQQRHALAAIHRNSLAQARLVEDVLDLSGIVAGRLSLAIERVDFAQIAELAVESILPATLARHQELRVHAAPPVILMGDPNRLRQVAWNLLSNATKFTPEGGAISVTVATTQGQAVLSVADTGIGIDPEFLPHVFDAFRQQDSSTTRPHGGLGIGLALVQHLVKAHGGTVAASSAGRGRGTTVVVRIPVGEACLLPSTSS